MNIYRTEFFCVCPNNGVRIKYALEIRTQDVLPVEQLIAALETYESGFHEEIADQLRERFGGHQTLIADHHGVQIETQR